MLELAKIQMYAKLRKLDKVKEYVAEIKERDYTNQLALHTYNVLINMYANATKAMMGKNVKPKCVRGY